MNGTVIVLLAEHITPSPSARCRANKQKNQHGIGRKIKLTPPTSFDLSGCPAALKQNRTRGRRDQKSSDPHHAPAPSPWGHAGFTEPFSPFFWGCHCLGGLSDLPDGLAARKRKPQGDAGARLDSIADVASAAAIAVAATRSTPLPRRCGCVSAASRSCGLRGTCLPFIRAEIRRILWGTKITSVLPRRGGHCAIRRRIGSAGAQIHKRHGAVSAEERDFLGADRKNDPFPGGGKSKGLIFPLPVLRIGMTAEAPSRPREKESRAL